MVFASIFQASFRAWTLALRTAYHEWKQMHTNLCAKKFVLICVHSRFQFWPLLNASTCPDASELRIN